MAGKSAEKSVKMRKEEIRQQAVEYFQQGRTIPEIAELLSLNRVGTLRAIPNSIIRKRIEELLREGKGNSQIGKLIGIDKKTVKNHIKKGGIVNPNATKIIKLFSNYVPLNEISKNLNMNIQQVIALIPDSLRKSRLKELYIELNLTYDEICIRLGISRSSLKKWLRKYKLSCKHPNAGKELKIYPKNEIINDYFQLNPIESIVKKRGFPKTTIQRILHEEGIQTDRALASIREHVKGTYNLFFSRYLREVIVGELLGDFSIEYQKIQTIKEISQAEYIDVIKTLQNLRMKDANEIKKAISTFNYSLEVIRNFSMARFRCCMSILSLPWAQHLKQIFENNGVMLTPKINCSPFSGYPTIDLWSCYSIQAVDIYKEWYPNGTKIVPRNLQITPTILLHWFIGDGSYNDTEISFSTHSFPPNDVDWLVYLLNKTLGIKSHWRYDKSSPNNDQPFLVIGRQRDRQIFFEYIEESDSLSLSLAKTIFPWKFDGKLRKKDVMCSKQYHQTLYNCLENNEKIYSLIRKCIDNYYFKNKE